MKTLNKSNELTNLKSSRKISLALTAASLLFGMSATTAVADEKTSEKMGKCYGINSCKGHSACQTADGACAGTNSCKGKGWLTATAADCETKGGKFEEIKKKK